MKSLLLGVLLLGARPASAVFFNFSGGAIPDAPNGGLIGVPFQGAVGAFPGPEYSVANLTVALEISGGYNFDFHVYLVSPNGTLVTLLNQPGSAYSSGSGFDITLSDAAATGIQSATQIENTLFTGTYQAASSLSAFNGGPANGTWTLYVQDLSPGASGTLEGWGLEISAVPEPINVALGIFSGGCALAGWVRWRSRHSRR